MMKALIATLFALSVSLTPVAYAQDQEAYQAKLVELQTMIKKLQGELDTAKSSRDSLNVDLKRNESEIADLLKNIERINAELASQKKS
jgi:peptidoglycan hydrolase CwlO-like protein